MRLAPDEIKQRIWPEFLMWYAEGGDNVAELQVAGCERNKAAAIIDAICARSGSVVSASLGGVAVSVPQLPAAMESVSPEQCRAGAVLRWSGAVYWLFADPAGKGDGIDIELMYQGPSPLLDSRESVEKQYSAFLRFLDLGFLVYDVGNGQALAIYDDGIFTGARGAPDCGDMIVARRQ